ncbi:hypothetical protein C8J57DRAFT_1194304 [Mycena rebaudengoi]|nr:hypothetical protein C8J57DRAFT_1194304 [Mycena rebaudengoi]
MAFLARFTLLLSLLFATESDPRIGSKCGCGLAVRLTRCVDCHDAPPTCDRCFISAHKNIPFHWVEVWNGQFFVRNDIHKLGTVITLGHSGDPCPNVDYSSATTAIDFTLVDLNGIHQTRFVFCRCDSAPDRLEQLMRARIFPASPDQPKTGFTFNLLRSAHLESLESKKSVYDYAASLCRLTNNAFPQDIPDIYKQLLRVLRVWRVLAMHKRSGQALNIDKYFPLREPGSLVPPCFGCPERGFNFEDDDMDDEELRYLYSSVEGPYLIRIQTVRTLFLFADGHFGLPRKIKVDDPDDIALTTGAGLFPPVEEYNKHVVCAGASTKKSTCARLNAANFQNKLKFRGCAVSGVVAVNCARHSTFSSSLIRYSNTDYALHGSLWNLPLVRHVVLIYDIACQYSVNLVKHFMDPKSKFPERVRDAVKRLVMFVPKLHLKNQWSLNFTSGTGRVHGEGIEGSWGEAKQAGGSTKEMNAGHRHDTLNDFQFDWNWLKAQKLTNFLSTQYTRQKSAAAKKLEYFLSLSIFNRRQRVDEWNGMSTDPVLIGKEWHSVYRLKTGKVPTQASVYQQLLSRELAQESISDERADTPTSLFINMGMKLESKQRSIVAAVKSKDTPQDIELQRHRLSVDIKRWRGLQEEIMLPAVMTLVMALPYCPPEQEKLYLPSDFTSEQRLKYRLTNLADLESKLREGEAHDALESLRDRIKHSQALRSHKNDKKNFVAGVSRTTRAVTKIMEVDTKIPGHIAKYRHARLAMIALGRSTADPGFPELKGDDDTYYKDVNTPNALNDGGRTEGWIWTIGRAGDLTDAERAEYAEDGE